MLRGLLSSGMLLALAALPLAACTDAQTQQAETQYRQASKKGLVILYFWGPKCGPCKVQSAEIEKFQQVSRVPVQKIIPDAAMIRKYGLTKTPTLVFLKDGQVVKTVAGTILYDYDLKAMVKQYEPGAP